MGAATPAIFVHSLELNPTRRVEPIVAGSWPPNHAQRRSVLSPPKKYNVLVLAGLDFHAGPFDS